jgi:hypothetical protein
VAALGAQRLARSQGDGQPTSIAMRDQVESAEARAELWKEKAFLAQGGLTEEQGSHALTRLRLERTQHDADECARQLANARATCGASDTRQHGLCGGRLYVRYARTRGTK